MVYYPMKLPLTYSSTYYLITYLPTYYPSTHLPFIYLPTYIYISLSYNLPIHLPTYQHIIYFLIHPIIYLILAIRCNH
jgi:hypothetical protein